MRVGKTFSTMTEIRQGKPLVNAKNLALDILSTVFNMKYQSSIQDRNQEVIKRTFLSAIKIVQEAVNHKGYQHCTNISYYGSIDVSLLRSLLTKYKGAFEILVVHDGLNLLTNRKLSTITVLLVVCAIFEFIIAVIAAIAGLHSFYFVFNAAIWFCLTFLSIFAYVINTNYSNYSEKLRNLIKCTNHTSLPDDLAQARRITEKILNVDDGLQMQYFVSIHNDINKYLALYQQIKTHQFTVKDFIGKMGTEVNIDDFRPMDNNVNDNTQIVIEVLGENHCLYFSQIMCSQLVQCLQNKIFDLPDAGGSYDWACRHPYRTQDDNYVFCKIDELRACAIRTLHDLVNNISII